MNFFSQSIVLLMHKFFNIINKLLLTLNGVRYNKNIIISGLIFVKGRGRISIGDNVIINSGLLFNPVGLSTKTILHAHSTGNINIGNNVGISNALISSMNDIEIQDFVTIGGGVQILDSDFHSISFKNRIKVFDPDIKTDKVTLSKGAFIGCNSIILKGVVIGEYSVVAAGSVVSKSIPSNEVWGGNPAKKIKAIHE